MSKKGLIVLILFGFIFMAAIGGGFYVMWSKLSELNMQAQTQAKDDGEEGSPIEEIGTIFSLDPFIVNLADEGGKRFLRTNIDLELSKPEFQPELEKRISQVRDAILLILPSKEYDDLRGVEGKNSLRDEILISLNMHFSEEMVKTLYFTEFVIQ
jgi:flagellar protein FliL